MVEGAWNKLEAQAPTISASSESPDCCRESITSKPVPVGSRLNSTHRSEPPTEIPHRFIRAVLTSPPLLQLKSRLASREMQTLNCHPLNSSRFPDRLSGAATV